MKLAHSYSSLSMVAIAAAWIAAPAALFVATPVTAQSGASRAVVQPLPTQNVQRLNRALTRLAKRPDNIDDLIEAGEAASEVGDLDAAIGFYGRAAELAPQDWRAKLGRARVYLRAGRPTDALPLFAAAQTAGADAKDFLSDRGLAFDLVGDTASAQAAYTRAIALDKKDSEAKRRLALSHAIAGNRSEFEKLLAPMLDRRDFASFRARAFGLAILGEESRASAIVDAVMPRDLALRINPYMAFMPRLTKAQQAAAANLGIFPRAADIGREDPRIAAYISGAKTPAPSLARASVAPPIAAAAPAPTARTSDRRLEPAGQPLNEHRAQAASPLPAPQPGFDLAKAARTTPSQPSASVADAFADIGTAKLGDPKTGREAVDLAAINVPREVAPKPEPVSAPAKPAHPARIWVQLATGRDVSALKFDWRRFARKAPDQLGKFEPHVTEWGQANRLLAGPVSSRAEARDLINALGEKGIETFRYSSPEGTEIKQLK